MPESKPNSPRKRGPQFSVRTLFIVVGVCALFLALVKAIGAMTSLVVGWILLLIAAHVIGNAWGKKFGVMRDDEAPEAPRDVDPNFGRPIAFAPSTRLRDEAGLGYGMIFTTCAGGLLGGVLGLVFVAQRNSAQLTLPGLALGGASATVIGGILGFLISSCLSVAGLALCEASRFVNDNAQAPGALKLAQSSAPTSTAESHSGRHFLRSAAIAEEPLAPSQGSMATNHRP